MPERIVGGLPVFTYDLFDAQPGVTHVVTTRHGGESAAPFDSLNLGLHVDDDARAVRRNRERLCAAIGCDPGSLTLGSQVHETHVALVDAENAGTHFDATDAMVTATPGVPLLTMVADCVVVGLYDPVTAAAGIAHAGWRGTLGAIAAKTVETMARAFGTRPQDVVAAISPSIGPCCYQVGPEVVDAFYAQHPDVASEVVAAPDFASAGSFEGAVNDDRMMLDLWKANALLLEQAGVSGDRIEVAGVCTSCQVDTYFSHRAEAGRTGRFGGVIMLREGASGVR